MTRLFILTLEPLDKRYTSQWYKYLRLEFKKYFNIVDYIDGGDCKEQIIKKGKFLDINRTNIWKAEQVKRLGFMFDNNLVEEGDCFILMDGWHFGITALKYMAQLNNIKIKIFAYWHAGTWDDWDFITQAGLREWAQHNELGWLKACDGHFVATQYHKQLIQDYFNNQKEINDKIYVVGFPMDWKKEISKLGVKAKLNEERENIVVFPHRVDKEKDPDTFDLLSEKLKQYIFIKTITQTKNKQEYYKILSKAKVVFSSNLQETFGIGTVEAMNLGCIPVVPNRLAYKELYNKEFKYDNLQEAEDMIKSFMEDYNIFRLHSDKNIEKINKQSLESVKMMSDVMLK